jgi:uncharacterized delta-60 repeat protein
MSRLLLAIGVALLVAATPAGAAAHDPGFGNGGWIRVGGGYDGVAAIAVRENGRIVVLTSEGFLQQRLPDGRLDRSFVIGHMDDTCGCGTAYLALTHDGSELVAMQSTVARFSSGERRDTPFRITLGHDIALGISTQSGGRFVVAVYTYDPTTGATSGALRRFLADGRPDPTFGSAGRLALPALPKAVVVQPDGALVVADGAAGLLRVRADGSPDPTFDTDGGHVEAVDVSAVALQPDGKILAAGTHTVSGVGVHTDVVRLLPDGKPDRTFGTDGVAMWAAQSLVGVPATLAALPGGAVAVAGAIYQTCPCKGAGWLAMRVGESGGFTAFPVPGEPDPDHDCWGGVAGAVAAQPDGTLLVGGDMCDRGDSSAFVGRLLPSLELDAGPPLTARLTHVHMYRGRITAALELSDAAEVTVAIHRLRGFDAPLLRGSSLGSSTMVRDHALRLTMHAAGRVRLALRFTPRAGARYALRIHAGDTRDRVADIRLPLHD